MPSSEQKKKRKKEKIERENTNGSSLTLISFQCNIPKSCVGNLTTVSMTTGKRRAKPTDAKEPETREMVAKSRWGRSEVGRGRG